MRKKGKNPNGERHLHDSFKIYQALVALQRITYMSPAIEKMFNELTEIDNDMSLKKWDKVYWSCD